MSSFNDKNVGFASSFASRNIFSLCRHKEKTMQPQTVYPWILYLNPELHVNEYKLVKNANLESFILIQDVRKSDSSLPDWLSVLPALVDTKAMVAYRSESCIKKLVGLELPPEHLKRLAKKHQNVF